uniref:Odorant-binding protein 38 n=1 Tax=Bradysia odoriphaga TaxID=1564500 RepID=A0A2S0X9J5_9DIPT|nr:odorant-binding protein 38 [Bradysia odoriphaga]
MIFTRLIVTVIAATIWIGTANGEGCRIQKANPDVFSDAFGQPAAKTHDGKCIYDCMLRLSEVLKGGGLVDVDKVVKKLRAISSKDKLSSEEISKIEKAIKRCTNHRHISEDKCETAGIFVLCGSEEVAKEGLPPRTLVNALLAIYFDLPQRIIEESSPYGKGTFLFPVLWDKISEFVNSF